MFVPLSLLPSIFLLLPLAFSNTISKPGCPEACGRLPIPYPFGVGSGCSLDPTFNIHCDNSTNSPKAYLSFIGKEVIEINRTYIRVKYPNVVSVCYDRGNATPAEHSTLVNLTGTRYTLPEDNWLTAIGCDDIVLGFTQPNGKGLISGCSTSCVDKNDAGGGRGFCAGSHNTATGNGCCQAAIYGDPGYIGARFIDLAAKLPARKKRFRCSHAFIQERPSDVNHGIDFSYPLYYLHNSSALLNDHWASASWSPVVVLNWVAGTENCSTTMTNSTTYLCRGDKSVCVDGYVDGYYIPRGYMCSCVPGYEGNPYLPGGCKPISLQSSIAKSGCQNQCGKLSIPFPFGVGGKCFLDPSFEILCDTTTNPPTAYLAILNTEILELNSTKVLVNYHHLASSCYDLLNGTTKKEKQSLIIDLSKTQYSFSDNNWINAIGCSDMLEVVIGKENRGSISSSCAPICSDNLESEASCRHESPMSWPGQGCCKTPIPRGKTYLEANLSDLSGPWSPSNISCSYALVQNFQNGYSTYSYPFLDSTTTTDDLLPKSYWRMSLALDWRIGTENCEEARRNLTAFVCRDNSDCVDFDVTGGVGGYICNCSQGFQGNPYISQGCKDIDECADNTTNPCVPNSTCKNDIGTYHCSCPEGYIGDGEKVGIGCILLLSSKPNILLIGMGSALGFLLLLILGVCLRKVLKKRQNQKRKEDLFKHLLLQQQTSKNTFGKTKLFTIKELEKATENFNENRICGQGGQGIVYKGMLSDGTIVAIKKVKKVDENQVEQFINEVVILSQINHKNVVRLLGCCLATEAPQLVYEFLPNGTLFDLIHHPEVEFPLTWNKRVKIAADIAGALAYLHSASSVPIYHRDIKSTNILLDEKYVVKVSDFGISKVVEVDQTHLTTLVKGTFGYLDPEYYLTSQYTDKSDVYSFGVVLVELLTGERPTSLERSEVGRNLATHFLASVEENNLDSILDPLVLEEAAKEEVTTFAMLARRCLNARGTMRPTMKEVATELESLMISQIPSAVDDDPKDKNMSFSDVVYTWTMSDHNTSTSSSEAHPLMFEE